MANWSDLYLSVKGTQSNIEKAKAVIMKEKNDSFSMDIEDINTVTLENGEVQLTVIGEGQWTAPKEIFYNKDFYKEHQLTGFFTDSDMSSDFYTYHVYQDGECIGEVNKDFFCKESLEDFGVDYFLEHYTENFQEMGWEDCEDIRQVFNECGYSDEWLKFVYCHQDAKVFTFIIGNNGTGKTTLAEELAFKHPYERIKSDTTRTPRDEKEEKWYNFKSTTDFTSALKNGEMIEFNEFGGNLYGTSLTEIDRALFSSSQNFVKVIEPNGLKYMLEYLNENPNISTNIVTNVIFMAIPEDQVLENLKKEGIPIEEIEERLSRGNIIADMEKLEIKPDVIIETLDENTAHTVIQESAKVIIQKLEKSEKSLKEYAMEHFNNKKHPTVTLAP